MKKTIKYFVLGAAVCGLPLVVASCGSDDNNSIVPVIIPSDDNADFKPINTNYVDATVISTYKSLSDQCEALAGLVETIDTQDKLNAVCDKWKSARQMWELSEAFLFGAASGYGIDPHIDTWPFDVTAFDNAMRDRHPATNELDAAYIDHMVATTQNFTGFHAMEYIIFRNGQPRAYTDITADEHYFINSVAADLYLSACRLEAAWSGIENVSASRRALLEDEELEPADNFGAEFKNAGKRGSRWASAREASIQIVDGCQDIIGEVADSKIGAAYTGADKNYIESPHAYNSIQDFYDNIRGCKQALYGGLQTITATTPAANSLMAYCAAKYPKQAAEVMAKLEASLTAINNMKRPFVLNYTDASAGVAIDALHELDEALDALKVKLNEQ